LRITIFEVADNGTVIERNENASDYCTEMGAVDFTKIVRMYYNSEDKVTVIANENGEELILTQPHWNKIIEHFKNVKQYY
jgi:hypothetical protein